MSLWAKVWLFDKTDGAPSRGDFYRGLGLPDETLDTLRSTLIET